VHNLLTNNNYKMRKLNHNNLTTIVGGGSGSCALLGAAIVGSGALAPFLIQIYSDEIAACWNN
jgi:hypothetical protein